MKFRAAVATAAAVPLALGLAACGSDKPEATGYKPSPIATTPAPKPAATTAPVKPAPDVAHLNRITFVPAMTTAVSKQKSWHTVGTMSMNGRKLMTMDGYQTANPVALSMEMTGEAFQGKTAKIVVIKNTGYVSIPGVTPAGKFAEFKSGANNQLSQLVDGGDPTKIYKSFGSSLVDAKFMGSVTVGGRKLERYNVTVNTAKALAAQGKKVPAGAPKSLTYELLLDSQHLVRQVRFEDLGISLKMTMTDYNEPVHITAPPASKIVK